MIVADLRLSQAVQIIRNLPERLGRAFVVLLLHPRPAILIQAVVALGQRILIIGNFQIALPGGLQIAVRQRLFCQPVDRRLPLFFRILPAGGQQIQTDRLFVVALVRLLGGQPVIAFPNLVVRVLIAAQIHIQGQRHVLVAHAQQFLRLFVGALPAPFRAVLVVSQTLEGFHGLIIQLVRQIAFAQQIHRLLPLILAVLITVQTGKQLFRFRQVVRAAHLPQAERLLIIAFLLTFRRVPIIAHGGKGRPGFVVLSGGQLFHSRVVAQGGQHPKNAEQHGGQRQRSRHAPADDPVFPATLLTALFVFLFQKAAVFLAGLGRHVRQLLFMNGDHLPHVFPAEAGKDRVPAPLAAAAPGRIQRIGAPADAKPRLLLHLGVAHRVLPGHKAQFVQRPARLQGVGRIIHQRRVALAPDSRIVKPDLFNGDFRFLDVFPFVGHHHHAEALARFGFQALHSLGLAKQQPVVLIVAAQRQKNADHDLMGQVIHHKRTFRNVFRRHGGLPQLHRTRQINLHGSPSRFFHCGSTFIVQENAKKVQSRPGLPLVKSAHENRPDGFRRPARGF